MAGITRSITRRITRREMLAASAAAWAIKPAAAQSRELAKLTIRQASDLLRSKAVSPVELTQACLDRIQAYNSKLNAFITVIAEQALADARTAEDEIRRGKWRGPLHGIPIGLKDNIDTAGVRTTGGSELFKDRVPTEDAEVARRLKKAGAILLGKLNLVEFAYGGNPTVTHFGTVHNPWGLDHSPGGSSSGPAAAVAADLCFGSLGTDTAGSIRSPAGNCGIVGLKPTYGRASLRGVIPLSWTLDHIGPICKTVEDAALILNVIAGYDPLDPTTVDAPVPDYTRALKMPTFKLRLGRPSAFFEGLHPEVGNSVHAAIGVLRGLTGGLTDVALPESGNPAQIWGPEAYAYHAPWFTKTPEKYQPAVRRSLQQGAEVKGSDYAQARRKVDLLRREIRTVFANVELLVLPTSVNPPGLIEGAGNNPGRNNNAPFDVFGLPAISIPCGFTSAGLPIGMQIVGAPFAETTVLALAYAYEQKTEWHRRRPFLA
ncbi:MAG: enantiomer-selective amidase [Bryobacterales bacterium]|nr:enantiomer-selective amidase [Bryobacterales bacterium]